MKTKDMKIAKDQVTLALSKASYVLMPFALSLLALAVSYRLGGASIAAGWFAMVSFNFATWFRLQEVYSPRFGQVPTEAEVVAMERGARRLQREARIIKAVADAKLLEVGVVLFACLLAYAAFR